jgi:hypothetical protein
LVLRADGALLIASAVLVLAPLLMDLSLALVLESRDLLMALVRG